ncbi:MAG: PKD domain-containing protein [Rhizobacter sp.]|nr:PKD domain-containing protein [Ferruginibacter sp.]
MRPILLLFFFSLLFSTITAQQYTVNGNALQQSCNCYRLTDDFGNQSGSVWNNNQIDLSNSFDYNFDVFLGNNDGGADGIAFVLQPISTSVGSLGGGMGYQGISPAIAITLDTYQNSSPDNDPFYDHIAIQRNGDINHASANNLAGPVQADASSPDIEDGALHKLRVVWDATTKTLSTYFDGVLRLTIVNDLVNTTFGGNPQVYWGFTGATGGLSNLQRFCTALAPAWSFAPSQKRCVGEAIQFMNASISFATIAKMYWNFGDGSNIDSINVNPIHTYATAGTYTVTQRVVGADGCEATNTQTVIVGSKPVASFSLNDSCVNNTIQFTNTSVATVGIINNWYWELDNTPATSTLPNPTAVYATYGIKNIKLAVKSLEGCTSDTLYRPIRVRSIPDADFTFVDSLCLGDTYNFTALASNPDGLPIDLYQWRIGTDIINNTMNTQSYTFLTAGIHPVTLVAFNGPLPPTCLRLVTKNVFVVAKPLAAMKFVTGCQAQQIQLLDSSYTLDGLAVTSWWWNLGNGQFSSQQNPTVTYNTSGPVNIQLVVYNSRNCKSDTLNATIQIDTKPVASFNISDSCAGNTILFNNTSTGNLNNFYWWLDNAGLTSAQQHPTTTYPTAGIKYIKLLVTSTAGCRSDTLFKPIDIYAKPQVDFTFTDSVCLGSPTPFSGIIVSNSHPVTNYGWAFGDTSTFIRTTQNAVYTFATPGPHTVTFTSSSINGAGCNGSIQKNVFVTDKPHAAIKKLVACESQQIQLLDSSYATDGLAITSWWWDLGNGQFSTQQNPFVTYLTTGLVNIRLVVYNSRNCKSDTLDRTISVEYKPVAKFGHSTSLCNNNSIQFFDSSTVTNATVNQWQWIHNNNVFSAQQNPSQFFPVGSNTAALSATSIYGCKSDTVFKTFTIKAKPEVTLDFDDACKFSEVSFTANETSTIGITSWHWNFGDGNNNIGNPVTHVYNNNNTYTVKMYAISVEGCSSDTIQAPIIIYGTDAFAGDDIIAAAAQPIQLNATGGLSYEWTPAIGLTATNIANPIANNTVDRRYYLRAFTPEGCESFDTVDIKIYKGPDIYVPGAFTPNGDGRNDILKPIAVGITQFDYFAVYNRYGQLVFKSSNSNAGWDGRIKGQEQSTGNFVWMVSGVDFRGNKISKKGSVLLIR